MDIKGKLAILDKIYALYEEIIASETFSCKRGCDACCTVNVTMTTLEAYKLLEAKKETLSTALTAAAQNKRFQPRVTVNQMADICVTGDSLPDEEADPSNGKCPALSDHSCTVYDARPFGCRCMVSVRPCQSGGYAEMSDFVLSVNTVFQQVIEHVDTGGFTGNFTDVLECLLSPENLDLYEKSRLTGQQSGLIPNRPARTLMIPPEHRENMAPILEKLQRLIQ